MKLERALAAAGAILALAGCDAKPGRYQVGGTPPVLLDTQTGATWRLVTDPAGNTVWRRVVTPYEIRNK